MNPLTLTVPDAPLIDILRGAAAVAGVMLLVAAPIVWWRARRVLPARVRGLVVVLMGADVYISATEAQQIGHPMLVWRLPLGLLIIAGATVYLLRLTAAVGEAQPDPLT